MACLADYFEAAKRLCPTGPAWKLDEPLIFSALLKAIAQSFTDFDVYLQNLLAEIHPQTSVIMLPVQEQIYGVGGTLGYPTTLQGRRNAILAKANAKGGQSPQFFINLASQLGFTITIDELVFNIARAGVYAAGTPFYGEQYSSTWVVNAPLNTVTYFRAGESWAGEPTASWGNTLLENTLNTLKPAHTNIIFSYS